MASPLCVFVCEIGELLVDFDWGLLQFRGILDRFSREHRCAAVLTPASCGQSDPLLLNTPPDSSERLVILGQHYVSNRVGPSHGSNIMKVAQLGISDFSFAKYNIYSDGRLHLGFGLKPSISKFSIGSEFRPFFWTVFQMKPRYSYKKSTHLRVGLAAERREVHCGCVL